MDKSSAEYVGDFLLEFLPELLPKPIDAAAKAAVKTFRGRLDELLSQARLKRELLEAAMQAELGFRAQAPSQLPNADLVEAVASFPLFDRELFQKCLLTLPEHLNEDFLAKDLEALVNDDWKGKFKPAELRAGIAIYLNCLRVQLLKLDAYRELVVGLAVLRTDVRTADMQADVKELIRRSNQARPEQKKLRVELILEGEVQEFTTGKRDELIGVLATLLHTEKGTINILRVAAGSVRVLLELPEEAARALVSCYQRGALELTTAGVSAVRESSEHIESASEAILKKIDELSALVLDMQRGVVSKTSLSIQAQPLTSLFQLPPAPADFTGREKEIEQILSDFENHKGATISGLTGMGGIGKTALGLVVANQLCEKYPGAQIFLDLKGTTVPLSALDIIRHVILSFEPTADLRNLDQASAIPAYQSVLHDKKVLIFLDNARSAEQIAGLAPNESCGVLVTSRWSFAVPGLQSRRVDVLEPHEAVEFLLQLCPRLGDKAAELAHACGYLPLALRIAGSFLLVNRDRHVGEYLAELNDRKRRLSALHAARQDTDMGKEPDLLATFELSYSQLSEDERKNWRMLGVFPAPFTSGAAAYLWELEEEPARKLLGLLCRYSLLDYNESSERYDLHDLLADYAEAQLTQDEVDTGQLRHAKYYLDVLRAADELYLKGGDEIIRGLQLFDAEWDHIRAGQAWASQNAGKSTQAKEFCASYPNAGIYCLGLRLHPGQRIAWLDASLGACQKLGHRPGEGSALVNLGLSYADLGEAHKAIEFHEKALVILREIGDRLGQGNALGNLGLAYADLGDEHKAIEFYEKQLAIVHEIGDRRGEGRVLNNLGLSYADLGEAHKAVAFYEQALVIDREIGNRQSEGRALGNLGNAYAALGETHKAIEFYERDLVIAKEIGDRRGEASSLGNLGNAYARLGEAHKAVEFYEQHLAIAKEIGDRRGEANDLGNLGVVYKNLGDVSRAKQLWQDALKIYVEIDSPRAKTVRKSLEDLK